MPEVFDKMSAFDDDYASLTDWYVQNPDSGIYTKLDIVSPDMDGTNPSKIFLSIADLMKSDLTSTTSGAANALYSLGVFINYAVQANAFGSYHVLEATREHALGAAFVNVSTNQVYGQLAGQRL